MAPARYAPTPPGSATSGWGALYYNTTGNSNTASGEFALGANITVSSSRRFKEDIQDMAPGLARSVSVVPFLSPGIVAALSVATIAAPLPGRVRCSSAGVSGEDENAARILSAGTAAPAADVLNASADPLDFRDDL